MAVDRIPTPAPSREARRWFALALGVAIAILVAIGTFNAYVDPFQQFRIATRYPPRYYASLHRYITPGLAKNARYDTLLTGSSIVENTRNDTIGASCGGVGLNVAMPALTGYEQGLILRTALTAQPLKRAIVVLDFTGFGGPPDARHPLAGPLPTYLYDRNPLNDFPYLLSWGVLVKSWRIVTGDASERFRTDAIAPWWWADQKHFARAEVLRHLDPRDLNAQFPQPALEIDAMRMSFARNILPLLEGHPQTEFDLVWPPYSIIVWADYVQRRQLDVTLAFKRYVFDATRSLPNVHVIDLQGVAEVTHDLDLYTDLYHFAPSINEWLIDAACHDRHRVRAGNVDAFLEELRAQALAFDPAGLAAK
ncbi:MAG TPA: hypothetical protein VF959_10185 [Casimicrobiaceae bacterium]